VGPVGVWGGRDGGHGEAHDKEREKPGKWRPVAGAGAGAGGEPRGGRIGCGRALPWAKMWLDSEDGWMVALHCRGINHAGMLLPLQWQCFPLFRRCEPPAVAEEFGTHAFRPCLAKKLWKIDTVPLSFVFDKYYPIID